MHEMAVACLDCQCLSIYEFYHPEGKPPTAFGEVNLEALNSTRVSSSPVRIEAMPPDVSPDIPERISGLFVEAALCRQAQCHEAAGAIFRKTIDVATKYLFQHDDRLKDRKPADALRSRIRALGEMKILDEDIVELADVVALDGNDAAHDMDPYTPEESEALEALTSDLLDRLFVRPARVAKVKAKQVAAGQRQA